MDNHRKHVKEHEAYLREYHAVYLPNLTVEGWLSEVSIIENWHCEKYPNARKARDIKESKLYKALE